MLWTFKALKEYMETLVYFKHCNLDGLEKSDIKLRFFRENSLICCADDMPRKMYIIRQGAAKVYRQVNDYEFIVAGVLRIILKYWIFKKPAFLQLLSALIQNYDKRAGNGFGFNLSSRNESNLFLVSAGCEVIVIDSAIFECMRNLKVNANLTLLTGKVYCISVSELISYWSIKKPFSALSQK